MKHNLIIFAAGVLVILSLPHFTTIKGYIILSVFVTSIVAIKARSKGGADAAKDVWKRFGFVILLLIVFLLLGLLLFSPISDVNYDN